MPALPSPGNIIEFKWFYLIGTDAVALNRQYYRWSGTTPTAADMIIFAGHAVAAWNSFAQPMTCGSIEQESVTAIDLSSATGASGLSISGATGSRGGICLPAASCAVLSMAIGRRYRGGKPRTYWPWGVAADLTDAQHWTSGFITAANSAASSLSAYMAAGVSGSCALGPQVNVSYYQSFLAVMNPITGRYRNVPLVRGAPVVDNILAWTTKPEIGSQRRRNLQRS